MVTPHYHTLGIQFISNHLSKTGFEIVDTNNDVSKIPQIVAKKHGAMFFVIVATFIDESKSLPPEAKESFSSHANSNGAHCLLAVVYLRDSGSKDANENNGYFARFSGLEYL